jgi:hypothetical protein
VADVRSIPPEFIREAIGRALAGGRFFVAATKKLFQNHHGEGDSPILLRGQRKIGTVPGGFETTSRQLRVEHVASEQAVWEVFRGHLLDASHTRRVEEFETWNVFLDEASKAAEAPLVSVRWQQGPQRIYIVRRILTHGFEAYEDSPGVILSREVRRWVAELVGTIALDAIDKDELESELARYLFLAVIGTSRLPITSLESPLPAFSLGELAYLPCLAGANRTCGDPEEFLRAALESKVSTFELAKALELALRVTPPDSVAGIARMLREAAPRHTAEPDWCGGLFRALFNSAVLSPYTGYVDALVGVLTDLASQGEADAAQSIDTVGYMLRHLCRHLTAFDLSVFHNFGANYPDALFLDALLAAYLRLIDTHPGLFVATSDSPSATNDPQRMRRRALRQACLVRSGYEGHRVPDAPASMGENARVLPAEFTRVPEEQILQAARRSRRLFEGRPLAELLSETGRRVLMQSCEDLQNLAEARELGMAVFLDRPMGVFKEPGEVDRTPLVSYEAFSCLLAKKRLAQAKAGGWIDAERHGQTFGVLNEMPFEGRPLSEIAVRERPGVVSLADAAKAAPDFRILRTTCSSLDALLSHFGLSELERISPDCAEWLLNDRHVLLVSHSLADQASTSSTLRFYDPQGALRLELGFESTPERGVQYRERGGVELVERLRVLSLGGSAWLRSR